jgi:hypothetical protein
MDALSEAAQKVGAAMYEAGKSENPKSEGAAQAPDDKKEEGPVDAEYKEVK